MLTHIHKVVQKTVFQHLTYTLMKSTILLVMCHLCKTLKVKNGCKLKLFTNKVYKIKAVHEKTTLIHWFIATNMHLNGVYTSGKQYLFTDAVKSVYKTKQVYFYRWKRQKVSKCNVEQVLFGNRNCLMFAKHM